VKIKSLTERYKLLVTQGQLNAHLYVHSLKIITKLLQMMLAGK